MTTPTPQSSQIILANCCLVDFSPTPTRTTTPTQTPTYTITPTQTPTNTFTPTQTPTNSVTPTHTPTHTMTPSVSPTNTVSPTFTPTNTITQTVTITQTRTPTKTPVTPTPTRTPTSTLLPPAVLSCDTGYNLLENSSFSIPYVNDFTAESWTLENVDRHTVNTLIGNGDRNWVIDLNACSTGYIEQSFYSNSGNNYTVKFNLSANLAGATGTIPMKASILRSDNSVLYTNTYNYTVVGSPPYSDMNWQVISFSFTSDSPSNGSVKDLKIKLESLCSSCLCYGPVVDDVILCGLLS